MIKTTLDEHQAEIAIEAAAGAPQGGWIVEVGCYHGRGTVLLGEAKHSSVLLTCIDPFPESPIFEDCDRFIFSDYSVKDWDRNTKHLTNVERVRGFSPINISFISFSRQPDLIVIDLNKVHESLSFWDRFLAPGGKFLVHTYYPSAGFPEVFDQVKTFLKYHAYQLDDRDCSVILTK